MALAQIQFQKLQDFFAEISHLYFFLLYQLINQQIDMNYLQFLYIQFDKNLVKRFPQPEHSVGEEKEIQSKLCHQ